MKKTIYIILYILAVFIFQELTFRFCFPIREVENLDRVNYMKLYYDGRGSMHSRDRTWQWKSIPDTQAIFNHEMNLYGFRDKEWEVEKKPNQPRVLFIGDSFVEGIMAEYDETISESFEKASEEQNYEALNGGLLGCGLDAYLQLAADMIPVYKPDVVFLCIYANDLGKKTPVIPEFYLEPEFYNPYTPRLVEIIKQIHTYGPIRFRWMKDPSPYLPAVPDPSNPWTTFGDTLAGHVEPQLAEEMKKANINPFLTNALSKEEKYLKSPPLLGDAIPFFDYTCKQFKARPVVVYIPSRNQVTTHYLPYEKQFCLKNCPDSINLTLPQYQIHQKVIREQCQMLNIPFIDLTSTVKEKEDLGQHLYWNYDQHMRAKGYELLGKSIWEQWSNHLTTVTNP
ncbi:MAG: hypothetical protein KDD99_13695 [Bacteroidetes bacterium]|nr:hypothetical protein [Bacteroidota bacterium]